MAAARCRAAWRRRSPIPSARSTSSRKTSSSRGVTQFGSGWSWLAVQGGKIVVTKTPNGESPLVHGGVPILGVDVWEHSYYIDYRNRRPDYLKAFVEHLVNWEYVDELFQKATA
jgi:Fe-Mn family superoxide dismutase